MDSFLGAGNLYLDRLASDGTSQGLKQVSVSKFELSTESELKEQISKGRDDFGQVLASVNLPGKTKINLTFDQVDSDVLAMAFMGTATALTQASGSVADQDFVAIADRYVELGKEVVTNVVVKDETDTTTHVVDVDYIVEPTLGLIQAVAGGGITDGATLHVSFDHAEITGKKVEVGNNPIIRARLVLDGKNLTNGKRCKVVIAKARFSSSAVNDYLSGEFFEAPLEGLAEIPDGGGSAVVHTDYD